MRDLQVPGFVKLCVFNKDIINLVHLDDMAEDDWPEFENELIELYERIDSIMTSRLGLNWFNDFLKFRQNEFFKK